MEGKGNEGEYDEIEQLLCEIPNVTAPNPSFGRSVGNRAFEDQTLDLASAFSEMSFVKKQTFSDLNAPTMLVSSFQTPTNVPYGFHGAAQENASTNVPCGFYGAAQETALANVPYGFHGVTQETAPTNVPCGFYGAAQETAPTNVPCGFHGAAQETAPTNVPYGFHGAAQETAPTNVPCGFYGTAQETAPTLSGFTNSHSVRRQVPNYSYLSNTAVMSDHQQMLQQHRVRHQIGWRNMNMDMDKEWLYQIQLRMESGNSRFLSMNTARQHEHLKQEPFWNAYAMPKASNQSEALAWDRMGRQNYPDRVFGRSHGMTMVSAARSWDPAFETSADLKTSHLIRYNSLDEVSGRIYLMARDQYGCRFLQRKFSEGTREEVDMIFSEITDHIVDLMTDPFGNYLVQKLLEVCNDDQLMRILHLITRSRGELVRVSCDMHGTRAVQKIIETLKTEEQFRMVVSALKQNAVGLMKNMNGNHVAQKCLQHLMPQYCEFLFEAASRNCVELATDRHGCCVLQKCLGLAEGELRKRLICEIAANALLLSQDPFGNYVVQYVFDVKEGWATEKVVEELEGRFGELAVQKHSSNVVERCLKCVSEEARNRIVLELLSDPRLPHIMHHPFGNYVTQAALHHSTGGVHAKLVEAIKPYVSVLRTSPYGKKVLTRLTSNK